MIKPYYQDDHCNLTEDQWKNVPKSTRCLLRKKGINVPRFSAGVPKGYKQTKEHVSKRILSGESHPNWKGDNANIKTGRCRAERLFKVSSCQVCGRKNIRIDRHHKDGNTLNNSPENIAFLCRKCHMAEDGRLEKFIELAKENQPNAVASRWN